MSAQNRIKLGKWAIGSEYKDLNIDLEYDPDFDIYLLGQELDLVVFQGDIAADIAATILQNTEG